MQDRVGEVLAERAAVENGVGPAIVLSILLHAGLSALATWAAWRHAAVQTASVMTIRFAQPPQTEIAPAPVTATQAPPPLPKVEPKPIAKTAPPSPFGKSKKKPAEPPPQPSKPTTSQPVAEVPIGGSGVTALEGGDFPYTIYIDRMKTLIGSHWLRPQTGGEAATIVYYVIDRDGSIRDTKIEMASGNGTFDRAALRAVLESSPLPPLPFGYSGTYLGVHLKFR
jgi:TonB family protein